MSNGVPTGNGEQTTNSRRLAAIAALVLLALAVTVVAINSIRAFPRGLLTVAMVTLSFVTVWAAFPRPGRVRQMLMVLAGLLLVGAIAVLLTGRILAETFVAIGLFLLSTVAARRAFRMRIALPRADRPTQPVMIWNPRSGRGQASGTS